MEHFWGKFVVSPVPDLPRVSFGPFELDASAGKLLRSGIPLKLQPQPFRVLVLFVSRPGQVVSREEIQRHLWGDSTFVDFERGINFSINQIRTVLCDQAEKPRYIETLPRVGYRFIASVERFEERRPSASETTAPRSGARPRLLYGRGVLATVVIAAMVAILIAQWIRWPQSKAVRARSTAWAVLPFQNDTSDAEIDFLRFALADEIANALVSNPSLPIRPTAMTRKYVGPEFDIARVGRELHVAYIASGHYVKEGDGLQVTIEVVDVENAGVVWRDRVASPEGDMIKLREEINKKLQGGLFPKLGISATAGTMTQPHSEKAYDSYLRSIPMSSDPMANAQAISLLESAVAGDPSFAPAWEALGRRYNYAAEFANGGKEMMDRSDAALEKALALDQNRIIAAGELITHRAERRDLAKAFDTAQRLVKSYPHNAHAHYVMGYVYRYAGMLDLSAEECERALVMDRGNYNFHTCAWTFTELGKTERALEFIALAGPSEWTTYATLTVLIDQGKLTEAREVVRTLSSNPNHFRDLLEGCLQPAAHHSVDALAQQAERTLNIPVDPEVLYYQGAILVFCGKQREGVHLLAGAISGNYCARTALETDPLLAKARGTSQFAALESAADECQQRLRAQRQ